MDTSQAPPEEPSAPAPTTGTDTASLSTDDWSELLGALVAVADLLLTDLETEVLMQRMASVLTRSIPNVISTSVTVETGDRHGATYRLVAAADDIAERIDHVQYETSSGPCVQALATAQEVLVPRLPVADWPEFSAAAAESGVDWSMSVPMQNGTYAGVLNIYAAGAGAYDEARHLIPARIFARYAATILAAHLRYVDASTEVSQLHDAMTSRATIEQAKGMIMLGERCPADEAFRILVHTSQQMHLKLRDVAAQLIDRAMATESTEKRVWEPSETTRPVRPRSAHR